MAQLIDLGSATAGGKLFEQAKTDVQWLEYLRAGDSQYQFVGKTGPGARLWLKQSIVPVHNPFSVGTDAETTRSKTSDADSTTRSTATARTVTFDESLYYDNASKMLDAMNRMFLLKVVPN